jgi:acetoin utilization deacetylase AcuC-like enzyme
MQEFMERLCKMTNINDRYRHHEHETLKDPERMTNGFCFINNVAVAAAYLKSVYRNQIK